MNEIDRRIEEFAKRKKEHDAKVQEIVADEKSLKAVADSELAERRVKWKSLRSELELAIHELNEKLEPLDRRFTLQSKKYDTNPYSNNNSGADWLADLVVNVSAVKGEAVFGAATIVVSKKGHVNFNRFDKHNVQLMLDTVTKATFTSHLLALLEQSKLVV